ncbi:MAG: carboxylating nicotinate-nucleotide diphosphorylase [Candidatus Omnitrophica bacterium]|nr:carboxylating nicotinate-nucleotide diphosphorylase [Candidatus Omnitrophota bacterium]
MRLPKKDFDNVSDLALIVTNALIEDIGSGDVTAEALVPEQMRSTAEITLKDNNVIICGVGVLKEVFRQSDRRIKVSLHVKDGERRRKNTLVATITGPSRGILQAERTALNFLGRLSGIATKTRAIVEKVKAIDGVKILDTRKTTPGLRALEKYAVRIGGGYNHRFGLYDQVLIKDNHIKILLDCLPGSNVGTVVSAAKKQVDSHILVEVEVKNLNELVQALRANPDRIMLDNMALPQMKKAVSLRNFYNPNVKLEASGNVTIKNISGVARCGVDFISLGGLTHSVTCADFSLNMK